MARIPLSGLPIGDALPDAAGGAGWIDYVRIARPDHWIKNIFVLPGIALAIGIVRGGHVSAADGVATVVGLVSVCLTASANYVINEFLDAVTDRFHPLKRSRPGARGVLQGRFVAVMYAVLVRMLATARGADQLVIRIVERFAADHGPLYNVPPVRSKDRAYFDWYFRSS